MGHQQYLPPMVPSVPFPGPDPRYPPIPQLVFPFLEPNSIASRRAISGRPPNMTSNNTHKQDSEEVRDFLAGDNTSSGLSKDEGSLYSPGFATRKRREDDSSTTCPSKNEATARNARDTSQRRDSASQQTQTSASSMPRSRLPSNEIARKAPLRAHTTPLSDEEDEEYTKSARKRPKAKQQRISAKPNGAVKSKRAQHPETPTVDPKNILNRKRAMDDGECEGEDEEQPRRLPEVGLFSPPKVIPRTRPRHNYTVPEKLNGTAKALGKLPLLSLSPPPIPCRLLTCRTHRPGHLERIHSPGRETPAARDHRDRV
jgi:hypothetical protein